MRSQSPSIANGDILTPEDAAEALLQSGADGVMIGRGAYGRPWLLARIARFLTTGILDAEPSLSEQKAILTEHYDAMLSHHGKETGVRLARKHVAWYSKGLPGSAEFRVNINAVTQATEVVALIDSFYNPLIALGVDAARLIYQEQGRLAA